jgi:hypothetical protein
MRIPSAHDALAALTAFAAGAATILGILPSAAVAEALERGVADGILVDGGTIVRLEHAYAYLEPRGDGDEAKSVTVAVLSDRALDEGTVRSTGGLLAKAKAGGLRGVQLTIDDATGEVEYLRVFSAPPSANREQSGREVHWLAEQFDQNTARGGTSYRSGDGSWGFSAQFNALIRRAPRYLAEGEAMGTLTIAGQEVTLRHALSWFEDRDGTSLTHIVLSDREISLAEAQDDGRLAKLGSSGRASGMRVTLRDEDGTIESQTWFAPELGDRRAQVATAVGADWEAEEFTDTVVRGRLLSGGPQEALGLTWEYDAYFAASIWEEEAR